MSRGAKNNQYPTCTCAPKTAAAPTPACAVPGYGCQVHHATKDWKHGGQTNITDEALACQPHNLLIENSGWTTRKRADGTTEWIPPPHLDTGQTRVNNYHHPERYLTNNQDDKDDQGDQGDPPAA